MTRESTRPAVAVKRDDISPVNRGDEESIAGGGPKPWGDLIKEVGPKVQ